MTSPLKKIVLVFWLWGASCVQAENVWFNIIGSASDPTVDTVEVDPTAVSLSKTRRVMRVRVSRAADRVSWDGVPYRSYYSHVLFDCLDNTARYLSIKFYRAPGWQGVSHQTSVYTEPPRLMAFRDVQPNPARRIVRAACETDSIISN